MGSAFFSRCFPYNLISPEAASASAAALAAAAGMLNGDTDSGLGSDFANSGKLREAEAPLRAR